MNTPQKPRFQCSRNLPAEERNRQWGCSRGLGKEIPTAVSSGTQMPPPRWFQDWPDHLRKHISSPQPQLFLAHHKAIPVNSGTLGRLTSANNRLPKTSEKVPEKASLNELQCFLESFHTLPSASMGRWVRPYFKEYIRYLKTPVVSLVTWTAMQTIKILESSRLWHLESPNIS